MTTKIRAAEIGVEGIGKDFGGFTALQDISLTIGRGEFLTLLGPSGSGKTTFLMVLAGFEEPTRGAMTLDGIDMTAVPAEQRGFGMVFQGYALFPHMSVEQNIAFPLKVQKRSASQINARVADIIEMVGLGGHAHKRPDALSGGQQQRVALARALACEPPVMLLDEPFSALDKNLRGQMQDEVRRLHRETGTTFVFVTHDQSEALALSSRVAIFERGRLQQLAPPRVVYEQPENRFVAEFLGDINLLPLTGLVRDGDIHTGQFGGRTLRAAGHADGHTLAVRPEYMAISTGAPKTGNAIPATVTDLTYLGADTRIDLAGPEGTAITLTHPTDKLPGGLAPGSDIWASWPEQKGFLL
ncbi:ABC transporter ATP-binding protein [Roseovarius sp. LXJ103]|uniref:ABC transporter ATP-binding protein n=1 Tax=Roseovarius carneus TaxID=2853164 RepID=UPI000D6123CC|nr:ABC transporter ATP-binding protein [Roseovarius carneus]MBZ8117047.1 ABC transporter ATP-binding protein [Roseovarius carneus]PWE37103.1 spermidine/putrescine ABC transporter [Pelagicola sp. LXJ1103]